MLRAVPMVHVQAQVPSRDGPVVTRQIAAQGLLHLIDIAHGSTTSTSDDGTTRELLAKFRDLARAIRRTAAAMALPLPDAIGTLPPPEVADFSLEYRDVVDRFAPARDGVDAASRRLAAATDATARQRLALEQARRLASADVDLARLGRVRFAWIRLGYAARAELTSLASLLTPSAFAIIPLDAVSVRPLIAIAAPASMRERVETALRVSTFEPLSPAALDPPGPGVDVRAHRVAAAEQQEREARDAVATMAPQFGDLVRSLAQRADLAVLLLQAQTCFATSGRFLVVSGWIPEARAGELTAAIQRVTNGRAVVALDRPEDLQSVYSSPLKVPILHRNPLLLRPFQALVELYGVPSYGEIQPTAFFAASFLLMFGLMFGDVGHGAVLLSAGFLLFRYAPRFLDYAILLMEAGVASTAFGFLHGSIFGVETVLPALWLHPIHDLPRFMVLAVALGVTLVSAGIVLNVVNSWRAGERVGAIVGTRGVFGAFVYWTTLALAARVLLPGTVTVPAWTIFLLLAGAAGVLVLRPLIVRALGVDQTARPREGATPWWLAALEGAIELVDAVFAYFANTISFVRVAAFAAVHAAVFIAVFALAGTLARLHFGGPLSAAALVAGNIVMILLEGLTVTVQVLRLEYYEFFGKFFRGGGVPYRPLMLRPNGART